METKKYRKHPRKDRKHPGKHRKHPGKHRKHEKRKAKKTTKIRINYRIKMNFILSKTVYSFTIILFYDCI